MGPKQLVEAYLAAFYVEHKDFEAVEDVLDPDFRFAGPMADFAGRDEFMTFIKEIGPQKNHIHVRKIVTEGDDVVVFHDFSSETPHIGPLPFAEWYVTRDGKIVSLTLYFDAREFAELIKD